MRGHWLSGTRKLNRHYQSGQGRGGFGPDPDGYYTYIFDNMRYGINGIEYTRASEQYNDDDGTWDLFWDAVDSNVVIPPAYYLLQDDATGVIQNHTVAAGDFEQYNGIWRRMYYNTGLTDVDVTHYGEIEADPKWVYFYLSYYGTSGGWSTQWGNPTHRYPDVNQLGKYWRDVLKLGLGADDPGIYGYKDRETAGGPNTLQYYTAYGDRLVKVLCPVYDVVSLDENIGLGFVITDDARWTGDFTAKIRVSVRDPQRIPARHVSHLPEGGYSGRGTSHGMQVSDTGGIYRVQPMRMSEMGGIVSAFDSGLFGTPSIYPSKDIYEFYRRINNRYYYLRLVMLQERTVNFADCIYNGYQFSDIF